MGDVDIVIAPGIKGRPTFLVFDERSDAEVQESGKPKWERPPHVRYVQRRVYGYLVCGHCGKDHRTIQYFSKKRRGPITFSTKMPKDRRGLEGPLYDITAMAWCDEHAKCEASA